MGAEGRRAEGAEDVRDVRGAEGQHAEAARTVARACDARRGAYLKFLKVTSFGALSNRVVGPLSPGLNVVFGRNEAGKTTLSSFVDGVLFGW